MTHRKLILSVGFAMFAMFFGAGNLVFPLAVGARSGHHLLLALAGFTLTGVVVPFLGLFAITLYHGRYQDFLAVIGKRPGFIVASLLILLIGLVVGTPRCSLLALNTITSSLAIHPGTLATYFFNAVFFFFVYIACVKRNKLVDLLGYILSPLKLGLLILVIIAGFIFHGSQVAMTPTAGHVFGDAILSGYGTMDLLAGFFFCAFIYRFIEKKTRSSNLSPQQLQRLALGACLVGAGLLAVIYLGFIIVAHRHSIALQGVPTEKMIGAIAKAVLDKYAALFVAVCVTLACFSTALALTAITTDFVHAKFVQKRVSHRLVLVMVVVVVFIMSNLGFAWLMNIAIPILTVLYPGLVVLTLCNIFYKLKGINLGKCFFYLTILIVIIERVM